MAIDIQVTVECANGFKHDIGQHLPPAVAFIRDVTFSRWWTPRCQPCLDHLSHHDQPTKYDVVHLNHPVDPAEQTRSIADHIASESTSNTFNP